MTRGPKNRRAPFSPVHGVRVDAPSPRTLMSDLDITALQLHDADTVSSLPLSPGLLLKHTYSRIRRSTMVGPILNPSPTTRRTILTRRRGPTRS